MELSMKRVEEVIMVVEKAMEMETVAEVMGCQTLIVLQENQRHPPGS
jgi:hypothetical protein